jgi:excisionase family DNA binding protein
LLAAIAALLAKPRPEPAHSKGKPSLLDPDQLAAELNMPRSKIMTLARQGGIPSRKVGKYVRFSLVEVEAALRNGANE